MCVFENCSSPDTRFYEQKSWVAHMQSHATRWTCRLLGHTQDSKTPIFLDEASYASHLRGHAKATHLKDIQIKLLVKQSGKPDPTPIRKCPLCHDGMDETNIESSSHGTAIEEGPSVSSAQAMHKHIASHLMLIASYSLPWSNDVDNDIDSDARPTSITNSSDSVFDERRNEINRLNSTSSPDEQGALVFEDNGDQEQYEKGEWEFLSTKQHDNLEVDHVLQDFKHKYSRQWRREILPLESNGTFPFFFVREPRVTSFVGRKDMLEKMDKVLIDNPKHSSPHHLAKSLHVSGLGGMGKSALALEYVYSRQHRFDVIIWLRRGSYDTSESDVLDAVVKLGLLRADDKEQNDSPLSTLFDWLSHLPIEVKWLLVLDGVDGTDPRNDFYTWPLGFGSLLTTGRCWMNYSPSAMLLQPLDHAESVHLLKIVSGRDNQNLDEVDEQAMISWARIFGGLPLALLHLAYAVRSGHLRYRAVLDHHEDDIYKYFESRTRFDSQNRSLSTIWDTLGLSTQAKAVLDVLCCLHPDSISGSILLPPSDGLILKEYPRDQQSVMVALSQLVYFSLISEQLSNSFFSIHRVVQEGRKSILVDEGRLGGVVISTAQLLWSSWTPRSFYKLHSAEHFTACKQLISHVAQVHRIYAKRFEVSSYGYNDPLIGLFDDAALYANPS